MVRRVSNAVVRRRDLKRPLTDDRTMIIALKAQRWARRKSKARTKAK